jgi:small subunit ribosomal protein S18
MTARRVQALEPGRKIMPPRPPPTRRRDGRRFFHRRKVCAFCVDKIKPKLIDYKDIPRLRRYVSEWAKIESHRRTGTCPPHQRALATAIKRARYVALLPYTGGHSLVPLGFGDASRGDRFRRERGPFRPPPAPVAPVAPVAASEPATGDSPNTVEDQHEPPSSGASGIVDQTELTNQEGSDSSLETAESSAEVNASVSGNDEVVGESS